jgi:hypothetical protein
MLQDNIRQVGASLIDALRAYAERRGRLALAWSEREYHGDRRHKVLLVKGHIVIHATRCLLAR